MPLELVDTHCHFDGGKPPSEFFSSVAAGLEKSGTDVHLRMLVNGAELESSRAAAQMAEECDDVFFASGVHPHESEKFDFDMKPFEALAGHPKCAAIGELGLDYFYDISDRAAQRKAFAAFLDFALETGKPAVVHLRDADGREDAYRDAFDLLEPFAKKGGRFDVHCFCGPESYIGMFSRLGAYFGVTGMVTFKRSENIRSIARQIPVDRLLLETDSPYLAPVPFRGTENTPGNLPVIAKFVAELLGFDLNLLAEITTDNAARLFSI